MKRVVAFIMTGALVTSLTGCSNIVDDTIGKVTKGIDTIGSSVNKGADAIGEFEEGLEEKLAENSKEAELKKEAEVDKEDKETDGATDNSSKKTFSDDEADKKAEKKNDGIISKAYSDDFQPYVRAYAEIIKAETDKKIQDEEAGKENKYPYDSYYLYDIDKDDMPELILSYGVLDEAYMDSDYKGVIYTMDGDNAVVLDDDFDLSLTDLYTDPGENGMLCYRYTAKEAVCYRISYQNGQRIEEELHREHAEGTESYFKRARYKSPWDIVTGSYELAHCRYNMTLPLEMYDEIMSYISGNRGEIKAASYPFDDVNFFEKVITDNQEIYLYKGDKFTLDQGQITFNNIFTSDVLKNSSGSNIKLVDKKYADINQDGKYECILYIKTEFASGSRDIRLVLTEQNGEVYAYSFFYPCEDSITEYGEFTYRRDQKSLYTRAIFEGDQAMEFYVPVVEN
ncbi:hypothetical protein [Butyrivibrio sp. XPD2002]|uniref:hypothetical protein n=1 Tax=Butyrivibrio sp. XPD2002 TaxID=1280665 RepID=UPI0004012DDF|nr:hypothetical protein [Butyrivibrio sp. XPD2002]